jgi:hypothetical protein
VTGVDLIGTAPDDLARPPGNKRVDGMRNLIGNPHVGVIFLAPGRDETLRINGNAWITRDAELSKQHAFWSRN